MSWPCASRAVCFIVCVVVVSAQQQPQAPYRSTEKEATRQSSTSGQAVRSSILKHDRILFSVPKDQLPKVKAASAFQGSVETLAAHLAADDDLVVDAPSNRLLCTCSGLAITATPEQQAAARAAADDMAAAVAALHGLNGLEQQQQLGPLAQAAGSSALNLPGSISITEAFRLSSRPGAKFKLVLDFDGNTLQNNQWNRAQNITKIVTAPYDKDGNPAMFNAEEIADIVAIWRAVAEDYAPFDVDVTTIDPGDAALLGLGQKAVIYSDVNGVAGEDAGIAFIGSFGQGAPAFVSAIKLGPNNPKYIWEAVSHELGHTLGLLHDGVVSNPDSPTGSAYSWGLGDWAPIMGVAYYMQVTQFDAGEYPFSNNPQDDLAVIGHYLPRLTQQYGSSISTATPLTPGTGFASPASAVTAGSSVNSTTTSSKDGVLSISGQTDFLSFAADAGPATITLSVTPPYGKGTNNRANLKAAATLYDQRGVVLQTLQPTSPAMSTSDVNVTLASTGVYYVSVASVADGTPKAGGFSNYGSLGWYSISAAYQAAAIQAAVTCIGAWRPWGVCRASCTQTASYIVTQPAANGGATCPVADGAVQSQPCSGGSCKPAAQNCVGAWGEYGTCSSACTQTVTYSVQKPAANGGSACSFADGFVQTRPCSGGDCRPAPQNCIGAWSDWSSCSSACTQTATFRVQQPALNGGIACSTADGVVQTRTCSGGSCAPQSCVGAWSGWSSCSSACTQSATYKVQQAATNGGTSCSVADGAMQTQACSGGSCKPPPQGCVGIWSEWSSCSAACTQTGTFSVQRPAANGGAECTAADGAVRTQQCSGGSCKPPPQDCVGEWSSWSSCSAACMQTTTYKVRQAAANGGAACLAADGAVQSQPCTGGSCKPPAQDCVGSWSDWGSCSSACTQTSTYKVRQAAANGGAACPAADGAVQLQQCQGGSCSPLQNCWGSWGDWSSCSVSCTQAATYKVQQLAVNGGTACPVADGAMQTRSCSGGSCAPLSCVGSWGDWSSCSSACTQAATYKVQQAADAGGTACPFADAAVRTQPCSGADCKPQPQDCVGAWSEPSSCTAACTQSVTFTVQQPAANGGAACAAADGAIQWQPCSGGSCIATLGVRNCTGSWGEWSSCSSACIQTATYSVQQPASNGGAACPAADNALQTRPCSGGSCAPVSPVAVPVNCVGSWGEYGSCSPECTQASAYSVSQPAASGGVACAVTNGAVRTRLCKGGDCAAQDCVGGWQLLTGCSSACTQKTIYVVTQPSANGGAACPLANGAVALQACSGGNCSSTAGVVVHCAGAWSEWGSCDSACRQTATYRVTTLAANGGDACPAADGSVKTQRCSGAACIADVIRSSTATDCSGSWGNWSSCSSACTQTQTYSVSQPAARGGVPCHFADGAQQTQRCSGGSCSPAQSQQYLGLTITAIHVTREAPAGSADVAATPSADVADLAAVPAAAATTAQPAGSTNAAQLLIPRADRNSGSNTTSSNATSSTGRFHCKAVVTLRTAAGDPLMGAKIRGTWAAPKAEDEPLTLARNAAAAAPVQTTRASGQAVFRSWFWTPDTPGKSCQFTVLSVTFPGGKFERAASVTSKSIRWR